MTSDHPVIQAMREMAEAASARAYCPYSGFAVGAAVLTDGGALFSAANAENASLGLTICAERNAIFHAVAAGHRRLVALVVYTPTGSPTSPCGACRQVLDEFGPDAEVFSFAASGERLQASIRSLLPHPFGLPHSPRDGSG